MRPVPFNRVQINQQTSLGSFPTHLHRFVGSQVEDTAGGDRPPLRLQFKQTGKVQSGTRLLVLSMVGSTDGALLNRLPCRTCVGSGRRGVRDKEKKKKMGMYLLGFNEAAPALRPHHSGDQKAFRHGFMSSFRTSTQRRHTASSLGFHRISLDAGQTCDSDFPSVPISVCNGLSSTT